VPQAVDEQLREAGVLRWHIWRDGSVLFHAIDSEVSYRELLERFAASGAVDPEWDALIAELLEAEDGADRILPLVWSLDPGDGSESNADPDPVSI
jgi:L-rhamnose mutarotase